MRFPLFSGAIVALAVLSSACTNGDFEVIAVGFYAGPSDKRFPLVAFKQIGSRMQSYQVTKDSCSGTDFTAGGSTVPASDEVLAHGYVNCFSGRFVRETERSIKVEILAIAGSANQASVIDTYSAQMVSREEWESRFAAFGFQGLGLNSATLVPRQEEFCRDLFDSSCSEFLRRLPPAGSLPPAAPARL